MSGALVPTSLPLPHPDPFETSIQINICRRDRTREEQRQSSTLKIPERRTTAVMETSSPRSLRPAAAVFSPLLAASARVWSAAPSLVILGLLVMPGGE